uniref:Anti-FecI sigma factor, FecR n=1 Tax=Caulobacter sp. (strain K31) TaxID=366602 RepID=B0T7P3_CAUSK
MSAPIDDAASEALAPEALTWVNRLLSGAVTPGEAGEFVLWRTRSPAHEHAFADALSMQRAVRRTVQAREQLAAEHPTVTRLSAVDPRRRAFLTGGIAAAAAAASYVIVVRSDLVSDGLAALTSNYHTGVGERRTARLADGVSLDLNTRTRIALIGSTARPAIELQSGEAAISAQRTGGAFAIQAGEGRTILNQGQVNVRNDDGTVCVTCLAGVAVVEHPGGSVRLNAGGQVRYDGRRLGKAEPVDTALASAWRKGLLIFRDAPLQGVVDELNRYWPGKIFLVGAALAKRPVYGVFHIDQIQEAVDQIRDLTGAKLTPLPGGVMLLR